MSKTYYHGVVDNKTREMDCRAYYGPIEAYLNYEVNYNASNPNQ